MAPHRSPSSRPLHTPARLLLAFVIACTSAPPPPAAAPAPPSADKPPASVALEPASPLLPLDPRVTTGTLPNGLTYFLQRQKAADQRAHLLLVVKAGSLYEDDDQRGLAHFVEHMAFSGTRRFTRQALSDFFEKSGLKLGSHANALTSYDRTQYQLSVPTDDPKLLSTALDVMEDWAGGLTFAAEEVQKERQVLLSEWTSSRGAGQRVGEQQRRLLLAGSRYAKREVIGERHVLESGPSERLIDFYRRWYRPDRMAVIIVGDIDPEATRAAIEARFSRLPAAGTDPGPLPDLSIPLSKQPTAAVIADPELPASVIDVLIKAKAAPVRTEADYREQFLAVMASMMLGRRLDALAENPKAPFTGASSNLIPNLFGHLELLDVSARAKEGQLQASLDTLLVELERVERHGFLDSELERTAREYARFFERQVAAETTVEGLTIASGLANQFITGNRVTGAEFQKQLGTRLLGEITAAQVSRAAAQFLASGQPLLLASGATRDALPEEGALLAALSSVRKANIEPHRDEAATAKLMPALPAPGSIVSERQLPEVGVTEWTLSNGALVVLKPTDFKSDELLMKAVSFGGHARVEPSDFPSARHAHDIVSSSGLGALDRQTVNRVLAGQVVSAQPWIDELSEGISASAAPKDVETMLQLVHLFATAPRRDEAAFEAFRAAMREHLRNRDLSPAQQFSDAFNKELWGGNPRRSAPTPASIDAIELDAALKFYAERFADMSDFVFVFVGKVDPATLRPLAERYLASLPGGGRKEKPKDLGLHKKKGVTKVLVKAGKEEKATFTLLFHGESPWSDPAHTDLVSLESYLSIRLREVLREQLGAVYTPFVSSSFERLPFDSYNLSLGFECKPADVEKLEQATRAIIAEIKKSGVEAGYLEKMKTLRTRDLEEGYRQNGFWLGRLVTTYKHQEDPKNILILHDLTQRITSENLRLAARKFLRDDQYVDARLMPAQ